MNKIFSWLVIAGMLLIGGSVSRAQTPHKAATSPSTLDEKTRQFSVIVSRSGTADYVCDGTADDVEIQLAVNAVNANGGGTVFLRAGLYRIASTIIMPPYVRLVGEKFAKGSTGGTILKTAASTTLTDMITATGTSNPSTNADLHHDIAFENITFDGNQTTTNILKLTNQDSCRIYDCRMILAINSIKTVWNSTQDPTAATAPGGLIIDKCILSANSGTALDLQYQTQCWITNSWFSGSSVITHINFQSCNKIHISNLEFNTATQALQFADTPTMPCHDLTINSCIFAMANGNKAWTDARTNPSSDRVSIIGYTVTPGVPHDNLVGSHNVRYGSDGMDPVSIQSNSILNEGTKTATTQTGGSLSTTTLISGTGQQISTTRDVYISIPITYNPTDSTPATATVQISPDGIIYSTIAPEKIPAIAALSGQVKTEYVNLRAGWYVKVITANASIGPVTYW